MNKDPGNSKSKKKTFKADRNSPRVDETEDQAYERVRQRLSHAMDKNGAANISSVIDDVSGTTSDVIFLKAYIAACLRKRISIDGLDLELRLMMLPAIIDVSEDTPIPTIVDRSTANLIGSLLSNDLRLAGRTRDIVIPTSRLLSVDEFENESPQYFYDVLTNVADCLITDLSPATERYVHLAKPETSTGETLSYPHDGTLTVARMFPVIQISPTEDSPENFGFTSATLRSIETLFSLCNPDESASELVQDADQRICARIMTLPLMTPNDADLILRSKIQFGRLLTSAQALLDAAQPCIANATISFNTAEENLTIAFEIRLEDEGRREVDFDIDLPNSVGSHSYIQNLRDSLRGLGVDSIELRLDGFKVSHPLSQTLH